jgi:hypothetical protein
MELPIGTIETLVNCNSQRKKRSSLKRFQLPRNTSPKRKSAKNITTDLRSLACLLALVTLPSSLLRISWRKLPTKKLLMRVCTYTVANPDGISVVRKVLLSFFFLLFFPLMGQQLGYGLKWRFCRRKCKLWMTHYSVSDCLQNPQIFFLFWFWRDTLGEWCKSRSLGSKVLCKSAR